MRGVWIFMVLFTVFFGLSACSRLEVVLGTSRIVSVLYRYGGLFAGQVANLTCFVVFADFERKNLM